MFKLGAPVLYSLLITRIQIATLKLTNNGEPDADYE
jgi:hypothetical protein